jgi:hypothetical protein
MTGVIYVDAQRQQRPSGIRAAAGDNESSSIGWPSGPALTSIVWPTPVCTFVGRR